MHTELYKITYGSYTFVAELDTGAEVGDDQLTLWYKEKQDKFEVPPVEQEERSSGDWQLLRTFYFEEANYNTIRTFCYEFANNSNYREAIQERKGRWIQRNQLFTRNLLSVIGEQVLLANDHSYIRKAREFFRWLDQHTEEVLAHPEYQRLSQLDGGSQAGPHSQDPLIRPAREILERIPGIRMRHTCQGVSGKIDMGEYTLLALTPHEEYAYISFNAISSVVHDTIMARIQEFPSITTDRVPCNFTPGLFLRSTGDNMRYREQLLQLAEQIQASVQAHQSSATSTVYVQHWTQR